LRNAKLQVQVAERLEEERFPQCSFEQVCWSISSWDQSDEVSPDSSGRGETFDLRSVDIAVQALTDSLDPTHLDLGVWAKKIGRCIPQSLFGANPPSFPMVPGVVLPELVNGHTEGHASRCETGSPHQLSTPFDPVFSLGSRLIHFALAAASSSHLRCPS